MSRAADQTEPDRDLIVACDIALAMQQQSHALTLPAMGMDPGDPRIKAAYDAARPLDNVRNEAIATAISLAAETLAGLRAKAQLVLGHVDGEECDEQPALSLARDVLALCRSDGEPQSSACEA